MDVNDPSSNGGGRSRRQKIDKTGRTAALEKFRQLKGNKNKYEVSDVKQVWQEVDEGEYSKLVRDRQDDDWIIDDDGQGYVEDGREIFDDDEEDTSTTKKKQSEQLKSKKVVDKTSKVGPSAIKSMNLKSMFLSMPTKRKVEKNVDVGDDDVLKNILHEMNSSPSTPSPVIKPTVLKKKVLTPVNKSPAINNIRTNSSSSKVNTPTRSRCSKPIRPRLVDYGSQQEEACSMDVEKETKPENHKQADYFLDSEIMAEYENDFDMDSTMDTESHKDVENVCDTKDVKDIKSAINNCEAKIITTESENIQGLDNTFESLSNNWNEMCLKYSTPIAKEPEMSSQPSKIRESVEFKTGEEDTVQFYWIDAYEDHFKNPGTVYLFGKMWVEKQNEFVSCCVTVRNIERTLYFLPREHRLGTTDPITFVDVYKELSNLLAKKYKIMQFRSKKTTKKYCFEKMDVPFEAEYLEVKYSAQCPVLPSDLNGETFSHVFGTNTSSLELLLLDQKIKGPCWLEIKSPMKPVAAISWCKLEYSVDKLEHVIPIKSDMKIPPVTIMAFSLKTAINPKSHQNDIIAFSCMVRNNYYLDKPTSIPPFQEHICAVTKPANCIFPFDFKKLVEGQERFKIMIFDSERALLNFIVVKFLNFDPDIIVGHDIVSFDFGVLLNHLHVNKIANWSRLGRLRKLTMPKFNSGMRISEITCGRLVCDVKIMAKEVIRSKSYDLSALTKLILKKDRVDLDVISCFRSSQCVFNLVEWSLLDVNFCLHIIYELNVLPLALQITNIAGNLMSRTVLGGRSERNEYLLLHAFTEKGYLVPDKQYGKATSGKATAEDADETMIDELGKAKGKTANNKRKAAYAGGLVLEPKKGFYDKYILLMDFNSLYPSIILEYNVCFTGMQRDTKSEEGIFVPDSDSTPGILPLEIKRLVECRQQVKGLLKASDISNELRTQYDIRQKALKLTANSMYGCLGFANSRFYAKQLAAFITTKGREILLQTKNLVQTINLEAIYGDTDSIMINTNSTDIDVVMKLGNKVKQDVNKLYRHLEIEIDGIFKSMLLLKKKKYCALSIQRLPNGNMTTTEEIKGVDIVRRDWSGLACDAGRFVISQILSDKPRDLILDEIHTYLVNLKNQIAEDRVDVQKWTITKQLTKNPEDYADKKSLPHVNVASRLNSNGGKQLKQGDTVEYVICEDGSNLASTQRAYHLEELKSNKSLKIDKQYYLSSQIHPVISRLCDPIEGMDSVRIADALGLDATAYRSRQVNQRDGEEEAMLGNRIVSPAEKFAECAPFEFFCLSCKQKIVLTSPFNGKGMEVQCCLSVCPNASCKSSPEFYVEYIECQLVKSIKQFIQKYYLNWMICDDPMCHERSRKLPLRFKQNQPICSVCHKGQLQLEFNEAQLYNQLSYYQHIFDITKASRIQLKSNERDLIRAEMARLQPLYNRLRGVVTRYLDSCDYAVVNFAQLLESFPLHNPPFPGKRLTNGQQS